MDWYVSCWNLQQRNTTTRTGREPDRQSALLQMVQVGRDLIRDENGTPVNTVVNVGLGDEIGEVSGFDDPDLSDAELCARIEAAFARTAQRTRELAERSREVTAPVAVAAVNSSSTLSATPSGSVTDQWARITRWLDANLPAARWSGAEPARIAETAAATGATWPAELVTFYELVDGIAVDDWFELLPAHELFDLTRLLEERQMELDVWGEFDEEMLAELTDSDTAGGEAGTYRPEFIPFAGRDGYLLFVDTRPGPRYGCVTEFDKVDTDAAGPRWVSLSAMLTDLADSLETGGVFYDRWTPRVTDGQLDWHYSR